jgi:Protein of unknown function (DUF4239)
VALVRPFVGWGNGTLLFVTFAVIGVGFNLAVDGLMRRFVTPEVRGRASPTAAVTVQVIATIYAVLVAFVIVSEYSQLRSANDQVASKAAELSAMTENSRVFPDAETAPLRDAITSYAREVVDHSFPEFARTGVPTDASDRRLQEIFRSLRGVRPDTPEENAAFARTLDELDSVVETRERIVNAGGETVPWPLVALLVVMGITVIVVGNLLDTRHRRSHLLITSSLALVVSLTLALVVSLNFPFDGILPISDGPIRQFLEFRSDR